MSRICIYSVGMTSAAMHSIYVYRLLYFIIVFGCRLLARKFATALPFRITGKVYQLQSFEQLLETLPASETACCPRPNDHLMVCVRNPCAGGWSRSEATQDRTLPHAASIEVYIA